jgi:plastocyanin
MDSSDNLAPAEEREPPAPRRRSRLLPVVALVAMAGFLVALSSLKTAGPAEVDLAAQTAASEAHAGMAGAQQEAPAAALPDVAGVLPAAAAPAAASQESGASTTASTSVDIMGFAYSPANLTIAVGDTVVWTNHDTAPHNVVISDGPVRFTSPTLNQGDTYTYTFTVAGTYEYYCSIHPDMQATITVEGSGGGEPTPPPSDGGCVSSEVLGSFMAHVESAHLERSLFEQVNDILAVDQYVLTHTVWLEQVLRPVYDGTADQVVKDTLAPVIAHIEAAHLERSPVQQVTDILAVDQYVLTHTVWLEQVLAPAAEQLTC